MSGRTRERKPEPFGLGNRPCGLGGEVTFGDLFPDDWVAEHTDFPNVDSFVSESGYDVHDQSDFESIPDAKWDAFVARYTEFDDWKGMLSSALEDNWG